MKTTKTAKKVTKPNKKTWNKKRLLLIVGGGLVVLALVFQLALDVLLYNRVVRNPEPTVITQLIETAVDNLHQPVPRDPRTGQQYLSEAKLVLPTTTPPNDQLLYSYDAISTDGSTMDVHVTTRQAVQIAKNHLLLAQANNSWWTGSKVDDVFAAVPTLQACSRGVVMLFDAKSAENYGVTAADTVKLQDGRTMYLALDDSSKCQSDMGSLLAYLKQAQSY